MRLFLSGDGRKTALGLGLCLTIGAVGCGGGGGGGGGFSTSIAGVGSGGSPTAGSTPTIAGIRAIELLPGGDFTIAGDNQGAWLAQQIIVDGFYVDGAVRDLTRMVTFTVSDDKVATVSGDGLITPVGNGDADLEISIVDAGGRTLTITRKITCDNTKGLPGKNGATPTKLEFFPGSRTLVDVDSTQGKEQLQQTVAVMTYSDGRKEDVTRSIPLEVIDGKTGNPSVAARATTSGLVRATQEGETVDVRAYLGNVGLVAGARFVLGGTSNGQVGNPNLYSGAPIAGSQNPFDLAVIGPMQKKLIEPSALATDGEFLRRVTADLVGRLPSEAEYKAFIASTDAQKREKQIDALLASNEFGEQWGRNLLPSWLTIPAGPNAAAMETALVAAVNANTPLSTIVTDIAQGTGVLGTEFDRANARTYEKVDKIMETFAGMTSKCARCHDHRLAGPADDPKFVQYQGYGLYAFFAPTNTDAIPIDKTTRPGPWVDKNGVTQPAGTPVQPTFEIDGKANGALGLPALADPVATRRTKFAQLFVASEAFNRGTAHRIYAEVMDPLLDPNQFLAKNLAAVQSPAVLAASTAAFKNANTSLKGYLKALTTSKVYQLSTAGKDTKNDGMLARRTVRRHHAEVVDAGVQSVTGVMNAGVATQFTRTTFGFPMARTLITERSDAVNLGQTLLLKNSPLSVSNKVTVATGRIATLATDVDANKITLEEAVASIYRSALSREPSPQELALIKSEITGSPTKEGLEDVAASVLSSIEFVVR